MLSRHAAVAVLIAMAVAGCHRSDGGAGAGAGGRPVALAGSIHTVAGNGTPGFTEEGAPARESSLFWPDDVAIDPLGRLCILDWNNHRVRLRRSDGTLVTSLGGGIPGDTLGPATEALINHPTGATWDAQGRLVTACWHNHKIKVVEGNGEAVTLCGGDPGFSGDGGPAEDAQLRLPSSVAYDAEGGLLILDTGNQRLRRVGPDGIIRTIAGTGVQGYSGDGGPATAATFAFPDDGAGTPGGKMILDPQGRILIADGGTHTVRRIDGDGIITTVAGDGTAGFSGDGGPATAARLHHPVDIEVGQDGTIFIADRDNDRVRAVGPDGIIRTVAGGYEHNDATGREHGDISPFQGDGGPATGALLLRPAGITLDAHGNLYIADRDHHTVRVVVSEKPGHLLIPPRPPGGDPDPDPGVAPTWGVPGHIDTVLGTGATAFSGDGLGGLKTDLYWPASVAVRPSTGDVIVADWNNHRIRMMRASDGLVITVAGNGFPGDGVGHSEDVSLFHPTGLTVEPGTEDLWIAAWHNYRVKRHSWIDDELTNQAGTGLNGFFGDGGVATAGMLDLPSSVAFAPDGTLYISDEGNGRVRRVSGGIIDTFAGDGTTGFSGDGGPATQAALGLAGDTSGRPTSFLATDSDGRVYIADTLNHRVRMVDLDGTITTVAGSGVQGFAGDGGAATAACLNHPVAVAVDADGTFFIADRDNHAVRRVDPQGVITTVAGTGVAGYAGDGEDATTAQLDQPHGLALDGAGNLYICDLGNGRVRVLWSARDIYARTVYPLLRDSCATSSCHDVTAQGNLRLDDEQGAYDALVDHLSFGKPSATLVVPGNAAASYLVEKLDPSGPIEGDRMPQGALPLDEREMGLLRAWIEAGAER